MEMEFVRYKHARFSARLPSHFRYSLSHFWMVEDPETPGLWRVGFTKFALRMLGELVDVHFERPPGAPVQPGDVLGSIEGFKAVSDIYCVGNGRFTGANPALQSGLELLSRDPYDAGWLYEFEGEPDSRCLDVYGYQELLNTTIDRILARQKADESPASK